MAKKDARPGRRQRGRAPLLAIASGITGLALAGQVQAAEDAAQPRVETVTVVGTTPLPGTQIDISKAPYDVRSLSSEDVEPGELPAAAGPLAQRFGGVNVNDNQDDPFQPDVLYRGFEASPVLGTPEGLAVYQNGVRINEAFGDTVNWDLVPSDAIAQTDVVGTNPVYGLNALGGAVVVTMKNGFDDSGGDLDAAGGSYGQRTVALSYGAHGDHFAAFISARGLDQDGWRALSADSLRQVYADVAARTDKLRLDLSYSGADNRLHGESPTPVQELAVDRRLIFTSPQANTDRLNFLTLNASYRASSALSFQGTAYARDYRQAVANGNTTNDTRCADPVFAGDLCQPDATTPLTALAGGPIPDLSAGGTRPIGENDRESVHTLTYGGALQATFTGRVLGLGEQLSIGAAIDRADIDYGSSAEPGVLNSELVVQPSGYLVSTPEGGPFTASPVRLTARNTALGAFATDTLDLTGRLSITASGRFNSVRIALQDRRGASLTGTNTYARFNPAVGATYRLAKSLTVYAGFAEGSRAPTASEIECSDPQAPCLLPSSLSADPPNLRQVVSRTYEAGLRGSHELGGGRLSYSLSVYRTEVHDDIYGVATSLSAGYFQNVPGTLRQGGEVDLTYRDQRLMLYASLAHVDATFQAGFLMPSSANPFRDAKGDIQVRKGDHLPGIPRDRMKLGGAYAVSGRLRMGGDLQLLSAQYYRGDEANLMAPLPGYAVLDVYGSYDVTRKLQLFARIDNALNARYATFGVLGDPTGVGAPGVPANAAANGPGVDNRFQSPAAPISIYGGVRVSF